MARFLAAHDGVITTGQAGSLGMTRRQVYRKTSSGLWASRGPSVHLSAEHPMSDMAAIRIAVASHGGVADRTSAAWLHDLIDRPGTRVSLSVPRSAHGSRGCSIPTQIRRRTFPAEDLTSVHGVDSVALPLTVLMVAAERDDGVEIMDRTLQRRLVTLKQLHAALDRNCGAHGMAAARTILAAADDVSESELERKFVRFLRRHGITGWRQQVEFGPYRLDFVFPEHRIAVELHGWAFHHDYDRWERDQKVTNALVNADWLPLIFTWKRLMQEPDEVLRELQTAMELRENVD
ncbi:DUF559 domain-containing protein [Gordonia humi]|uniref:Very-short-patch-repair endonuclease n=2 Tax=Gordonia humi TaxID=686429 RepID=A0A840F7K3_9ACTN|nr:very-short-patch-repair endonuclease [Gordonia humi]